MSSLFASLSSSSGALQAFQRALDITQNNVSNASTPGYAAQRATLEAQFFQPGNGLPGGVTLGEISSARDRFADKSVQNHVSSLGYFEQQAASLTNIQANFDISGQTGIPGAFTGLLASFSGLSVSPNSDSSRQSVIANAQKVADAFNQTAAELAQASQETAGQLQDTVGQINRLAAQVQQFNLEKKRSSVPDAGLDAKIQSTLENLSQLAGITSSVASDGTTTVLLGGQSPLVVGAHAYSLHLDLAQPGTPPPANPAGTPALELKDESGNNITSQSGDGKLGSLLHTRNVTLPALRGDSAQAGSLNRLAKSFADRVNTILTSGRITDGDQPRSGIPLFTYDSTDATSAARTLTVNPDITAQKIAAIDPGPPYSGNGIAVRLSALANPSDNADKIDNVSFTQFYGAIAGSVGRQVADARNENDLQQQLVAQARSLRSQTSGVSLDEEAVHLVEFQRAYQATAKMITILNELTQTTVDLIK